MRLINCQLENVRQHGDLKLTFSPQLTVISGPNESGKSTLVEALHRALFLKASASGAPVEALQSRIHLGPPKILIGFEAKGENWELSKRFSGTTGNVTLKSIGSGLNFSGPSAEDELAKLLGVKDTVGSKQATTILPTRWAHLWVMQGSAGANLLAEGKDSYDFDSLLAQLEKSGGAVIQQSSHDQSVAKQIEAALEANFTSRGIKKNSALWQRKEEFETARQAVKDAQVQLSNYNNAGLELLGITEQIEQLQGKDLPALEERRKIINQGLEVTNSLDNAVKLALQEIEPLRMRYDASQNQLKQLTVLAEELHQKSEQFKALQESEQENEASELSLVKVTEERRNSRVLLESQKQEIEKNNQLVQLLLEQATALDTLQRLTKSIDQQNINITKLEQLKQQLAALPLINKSDIQKLRLLQQQSRDANTRQQSMAAGVQLLRADQTVRINGEAIKTGEQLQFSSAFELQVGNGVALEIMPGGGKALGDLKASSIAADEAYAQYLKQLNLQSLEAGEQALEQRSGLDQQLLALSANTLPNSQELEIEQNVLQQRLSDCEKQLALLAEFKHAMEKEHLMPVEINELQTLHFKVKQTLTHTATACKQAETDLDSAQLTLQNFQKKRLADSGQLKVLESECSDRQKRYDELIIINSSHEILLDKISALSSDLKQAEEQLKLLEAQRAACGSNDNKKELAALPQQIDALQQQIEQLIDQRGAAKERCDNISKNDPFAAIEQANALLEIAQSDYQNLKRITDAHKRLQELFMEAQADLSSRYSEPLAQAINSYLQPLIPDGPIAQLNYDQYKGFGGLRLRRGKEFYDFDELSGGMREQLTAALRLSMADVLKDANDGCLPLVFDDAFANSDPARIDSIKKMLNTAVDRGLQVILLTCDPTAYGSFGEKVWDLAKNC